VKFIFAVTGFEQEPADACRGNAFVLGYAARERVVGLSGGNGKGQDE